MFLSGCLTNYHYFSQLRPRFARARFIYFHYCVFSLSGVRAFRSLLSPASGAHFMPSRHSGTHKPSLHLLPGDATASIDSIPYASTAVASPPEPPTAVRLACCGFGASTHKLLIRTPLVFSTGVRRGGLPRYSSPLARGGCSRLLLRTALCAPSARIRPLSHL